MKYEQLVYFLKEEVEKRISYFTYGNHGQRFYALITVKSEYAHGLLNDAEKFGMTDYNFNYLWSGEVLYVISKE